MGLLLFSSIDSIPKIMNDTPFRMVDVNTPSDWPDELQNNYKEKPAEYINEMASLFCSVDILFANIETYARTC